MVTRTQDLHAQVETRFAGDIARLIRAAVGREMVEDPLETADHLSAYWQCPEGLAVYQVL